MTTALIYDDVFLDHDTGQGHPERPDRLRSIVEFLTKASLWDQFDRLDFSTASEEVLRSIHDASYIKRLDEACAAGKRFIDVADSVICPKSASIARRAVGGIVAAVDRVMTEKSSNAFCALRPPGHHAERDRSMGFCLYNNVAIAAQTLIDKHKLDRVAIVDFDVHHGNGTQHSFEDRSNVLFISIHEDPRVLYPGTGFRKETGKGAGKGFTLNIPMQPGGGDDAYKQVFNDEVRPKLDRFKPQVLLISAGFDAADKDPLAHMKVTPAGFRWMSEQLFDAAKQHCGGKLISTLEGGYHLVRLGESVVEHVQVLMGDKARRRRDETRSDTETE